MCLSFWPSCDLIWPKDCLREEDWPKRQLGILSGDQLSRVRPCSASCLPASSRWSSSTTKANRFLFLTLQEGIQTVDIAASVHPSRRLCVLSLQPLYTGKSFHFIVLLILAVLHENILFPAEKDSMRETLPPWGPRTFSVVTSCATDLTPAHQTAPGPPHGTGNPVTRNATMETEEPGWVSRAAGPGLYPWLVQQRWVVKVPTAHSQGTTLTMDTVSA